MIMCENYSSPLTNRQIDDTNDTNTANDNATPSEP